MSWRSALLLLLSGACGRIGFDARSDAGGGGDGAALGLVKLSANAPLFDTPAPTSADCGKFSMFYISDDTRENDDLMPFAFADPDGTTLWFAMSCKYVDNGWSEAIGRWSPPDGTFTMLDGKTAVAGINGFVEQSDTLPDGETGQSLRQLRFAFGADGRVYGLGSRYHFATGVFDVAPVVTAAPTTLAPGDYQMSNKGVLNPPMTSWSASVGFGREILFTNGQFFVYSVHWDRTSMTSRGQPLTSIAVTTTPDMLTPTFPAAPLVTGWTDPMVAIHGNELVMVARDETTNAYALVHGTSPTDFDFAGSRPLGLASQVGGSGAWDELRYTFHADSGDPRVTTVRVVGDNLYVFYVAGVPEDPGAAGQPLGRRGLGVFQLAL